MGFLYEQPAASATQALAELANKGLSVAPNSTWHLEHGAMVRSHWQRNVAGLHLTSEELCVNFSTLRFSYTATAKAIPRIRLNETFAGILLDGPRFVVSGGNSYPSLKQRVQVVGDDTSVTVHANGMHQASNDPSVAALFGRIVEQVVSNHADTRPNPVDVISLIQRNRLYMPLAEHAPILAPPIAQAEMSVLPLVH